MITVKTTTKCQIIGIGHEIEAALNISTKAVLVAILHTTAALTTADLDPGTDLDFLDFLISTVPNIDWRHPHNPAHAPDHLLASLIGTSIMLPVREGRLILGTWQHAVLVELDGPRERQIEIISL